MALTKVSKSLISTDTVFSVDALGGVYGNSSSPVTIAVTVASKTAAHPYNGDGSSSAYFLDGLESPAIMLNGADDVTSDSGYYYKFDQADSSNSGHPLLFYLDAAKNTAYTTGVTTSGTPGNASAYTRIDIDADTPKVIYYQCSSHAYMGNYAAIPASKTFTTIDVNGGTIDGATIGASAAASIVGTTITGTQVDITAQGDLRLQDSSGGQYVAMQAPATVGTSYTLTMPADDGDADQYLQTNGSGVLDWATVSVPASAYNTWLVKTGAFTAASGDQLICNSGSAFTITLPAGSAGNTVIISNAGAGLVTIARNGSQKINSVAADGTLPNGNSTQLVYTNDTIGWFQV
jgi:hypothetical protein